MPPPKQLSITTTLKYSVYSIPKPSHYIFLSADFSDEQILKQITSLEYQVTLQEHQWQELILRGPCLVSMAQQIIMNQNIKTRQQAIEILSHYHTQQTNTSTNTNSNTNTNTNLLSIDINDMEPILDGMRLAAESYLARGDRQKPSWAKDDSSNNKNNVPLPPNVILMGKFRPVSFLARGSASMVYAVKNIETSTLSSPASATATWVLKRCYPTQMESARNEAHIASKLRSKHVLDVTLLNDDGGNAWLLLPRIMPCEFGVDLREFLDKGFFQQTENIKHGQQIVCQLLEGLDFISEKGIVMRDVKPDNVLIRRNENGNHDTYYDALWTDFGLAVDVNNIRSPYELKQSSTTTTTNNTNFKGYFDDVDVLNWWYDVVKLVPRPKWKFRKPPERTFRDPTRVGIFSYDTYMTGIIFASMSVGEDLPHLDAPEPKKALEIALGISDLGPDYLNTFELGKAAQVNGDHFITSFKQSFGPDFGQELFTCTLEMLHVNPSQRPSPKNVLNRLKNKL
jgi:serine/threonine protein kinase